MRIGATERTPLAMDRDREGAPQSQIKAIGDPKSQRYTSGRNHERRIKITAGKPTRKLKSAAGTARLRSQRRRPFVSIRLQRKPRFSSRHLWSNWGFASPPWERTVRSGSGCPATMVVRSRATCCWHRRPIFGLSSDRASGYGGPTPVRVAAIRGLGASRPEGLEAKLQDWILADAPNARAVFAMA